MQKWTPPRTMTKDGIFFPHLSTHLSAAAQRKEIREIFKLTRHPLLTEKMAELLYRTLHSGFWMGPNKCNKKRGDIHTCMVCGQVENVLHTFCECYKITQFLTALLKWWEHRTSEQISGGRLLPRRKRRLTFACPKSLLKETSGAFLVRLKITVADGSAGFHFVAFDAARALLIDNAPYVKFPEIGDEDLQDNRSAIRPFYHLFPNATDIRIASVLKSVIIEPSA